MPEPWRSHAGARRSHAGHAAAMPKPSRRDCRSMIERSHARAIAEPCWSPPEPCRATPARRRHAEGMSEPSQRHWRAAAGAMPEPCGLQQSQTIANDVLRHAASQHIYLSDVECDWTLVVFKKFFLWYEVVCLLLLGWSSFLRRFSSWWRRWHW